MESRNNWLFRTIIILECLSVIIIGCFLFNSYNKYTKLKKENDSLKKNIDLKDINSKIDFYKNIESIIKEEYDSYYTNINKLENNILEKKTNIKIAYLTFDDGPYDLTTKVLDKLKENNIRATFFVLGKEKYKNTYKRIVNEGHTLANHTFYHNIRYGLYSSTKNFINQVTKLEDFLYDITGYKTTIVRMPGGSSTAGVLKKSIEEELHKKGYNYVDWTCETGDGSRKKLEEKDNFTWYKDTCKQDIIVLLMHDYNEETYKSLQDIIDDLKKKNYIFLPLHNKSVMVK